MQEVALLPSNDLRPYNWNGERKSLQSLLPSTIVKAHQYLEGSRHLMLYQVIVPSPASAPRHLVCCDRSSVQKHWPGPISADPCSDHISCGQMCLIPDQIR